MKEELVTIIKEFEEYTREKGIIFPSFSQFCDWLLRGYIE